MKHWTGDKELEEKEEAQVKSRLKSEDEIKKYTWDDRQPIFKNLLHVFSSGTHEQKVAVLNNIEMYCDEPTVLSAILPKLCDAMQTWPIVNQEPLATAIGRLLIKKLVSAEVAEKVMLMILKVIDNGTEEMVNIWYEAFNKGIFAISWKTFTNKFLPMILKMAGLSYPASTRYPASQIIIAATNFAATNRLSFGSLIAAYLELCQDIDMGIRIATLKNLSYLLQFLDISVVTDQFLPELVTCVNDPNTAIRLVVLQVVIETHKLFTSESLSENFVPVLIKELRTGWNSADNLLLHNYGQVIMFLMDRDLLMECHVDALYKFYDSALRSTEPGLKKAIFRFIPYVIDALFTYDIDVKYESEIMTAAQNSEFQSILIDIFPKVVQVFAKYKKTASIKPCFETLLKIRTVPLLIKLFQCLPETLLTLAEGQKIQKFEETLYKTVMEKLKSVWVEAKKLSWRHIFSMLGLLPMLQQYFPILEYNEYFVDEAYAILKSGNAQTKQIASNTLCEFLSHNHHFSKRSSIIGKVLDLGQSICYYERISFLLFCGAAVRYFSQKLLHNLIPTFAKLANDKVSNLRIRFLETAKEMVIHLDEKLQKPILEKIEGLQQDKSRDVRKTAIKVYNELKNALEQNEEMQEKIEEQDKLRVAHEKELLRLVREEEEGKLENALTAELLAVRKAAKANPGSAKMGPRHLNKTAKPYTPKQPLDAKKPVSGSTTLAVGGKKLTKRQDSFNHDKAKKKDPIAKLTMTKAASASKENPKSLSKPLKGLKK